MLYGEALRDYVAVDFFIKCIYVYAIMRLESDEPINLFDPVYQNLAEIDEMQEEIAIILAKMED